MAFVRRWFRELDPEDVSYLHVIDGDGVLKGGLSLAELVLARPYQRVSILMRQNPISVPVDTDQEHCARLMEHYNLHKLAVVDDRSRLAVVLNLADMMEVLEDEATEDMYKIFGVDEEERAMGPFWRSVRGRLPWLCVNLATVILAGFIVTLFQSTLVQAVALVAFLPVIAGQGGIAGTQTLTLIVRSLALGEISSDNGKRLLAKEIGLGLVHGVALGALAGVVALVWKGSEYLALVVGVAMLANLVVAGASGVLVPLGFRALRIDPALASAVAVTTFTDVIGFLVYLGLAALLIRLIVGSL
jgi:magnesium transporter